jgi:hypothetical protein
MSKKEKSGIQPKAIKKESGKVPEFSLFDKLERWLEKHHLKIIYCLLFLSTLFSLLLFDSRVTEGGDDSGYIQRAWEFLHDGKYPYFQGPGYPVSLSLFVKLFGLNVIALKFFSVLCQIGFVWFTYKAFVKRIPYTVLFALIAYISFNNYIQYYASQTFTETFFLFVQSVCVYLLFRIIDSINPSESFVAGLKKNYLKWIAFGVAFVLLSISKSIAFVCIVGVIVYFICYKNYRQALYALIAFGVIRIIYQLITTSAFGPPDTSQLEMMLRKDIYQPAMGHENFGGMMARFYQNFNTYISLHMYRLLNLRFNDTLTIVPFYSFITTAFFGVCAYLSYKKNKYVFFANVYMIVLCGGIFFGVQATNLQDRLIIIVIPFIFLVLFFGVYQLAKRSSMAQIAVIALAAFMLVITISKSTMIAQKNVKALKKNLSGDIYYGYTPDWENFLKMSRYCADSLPDSVQVLSRKPNMSFIYGNGKKFVGQYWVTTSNPDSVAMEWKSKKIEYIILPNLRMNPKKNNGKIINTIHRMLAPYAVKYPERVKVVKTIGTIERCELYSITYE